jgi:3-phosphoshikimate 1-carboxyvinyltransferase
MITDHHELACPSAPLSDSIVPFRGAMRTILLSPLTSSRHWTCEVLGSKSYTNRALVTAALANGVSTISKASISADSEAMVAALKILGISIEGQGGAFAPYQGEIDVGPAGTTMRFLTALCAGIPGADIVLRGSDRMHARPIKDLVEALRSTGAQIDYLGNEGCPPLRIHSRAHLKGGTISMSGSVSSQFISAMLLTAPTHSGKLAIEVTGEQISKPYIDMTIQSVRDFGVSIANDAYKRYSSTPGEKYSARRIEIEGDASGASYLWGLAAIAGGSMTVTNVNPRSAQGDIHFPEVLARMGCSVATGDRSITVTGGPSLKGIEIDMSSMPDTAQTLAVVAACAKGTTTIRGLSTLRVKETDRIAALHAELSKVGIRSEAGADYLIVHGGTPHGARIATYEDHRMAMSFAMLAAKTAGIEIEEPSVVDKSFPTFWETLCEIGIQSDDVRS